jgi:hypothetical protein
VKARFGLGLLLILHGLAHVAVGMAAQDDPHHGLARWLPPRVAVAIGTGLFLTVTPGFVAAGLGAWNLFGLRRIWAPLVKVCVLASFALFALTAPSALRLGIGLTLDLVVLALADILSEAPRTARRLS